MRVLVALICGVMLAFAQDATPAEQKAQAAEQKADEKAQKLASKEEAKEPQTTQPPTQPLSAYSAVKGKMKMRATKNTRRLLGSWNATGFATDPQARQATKQAVATAAKTDASKVKVHMKEEQPGTPGRRLIGEQGLVTIDYIVEAENGTDAQLKHDLLNNTETSMLTLGLTNALVALGHGIYTLNVENKEVDFATQADLEAFGSEVTTDASYFHDKAVAAGGSTWWYWVVGGFGIAALAVCAYFCIAYSQSGGEKKKKKKDTTKRGVDIAPAAEAPAETASLAANPSPTPMYQPQQVVYNMPPQYMQPEYQQPVQQYFQYPQLVQQQPVQQYVQNGQYVQYVQPTEMQNMVMASEPVQYVQEMQYVQG